MRVKVIYNSLIPPGRETLKFLKGIDKVNLMLPDLKKYGLSEQTVKTSIELRPRRNGIKVYDVPDYPNGFRAFLYSHQDIGHFSLASLGLSIDVVTLTQPDIIAANVTLSQTQTLNLLSADNPIFTLAET
jgi:hypothetical protein